jgi:pimeloyl-ACP methyl ester carboxylesterase
MSMSRERAFAKWSRRIGVLAVIGIFSSTATSAEPPEPPGKLVHLGGHRLHLHIIGQGSPTVVVENGLGDFSFDWILIQARVARFARICTYDRAGYAWSEPGPKPRTFAQLNLELHNALTKVGERGPFILVGHSFGGPVVRNYASMYPKEVVGMILVDSVQEDQRVVIQGKAVRLSDGAKGRKIPIPREKMTESDKPRLPAASGPAEPPTLDPLYQKLPPAQQKMRLWAQALPQLNDAEDSQRDWSTEYFANLRREPQAGSLGAIPLIVLTRAEGGYGNDLDIPAAQLERERKETQAKLALLSTNSKQIILRTDHNMHLLSPDDVVSAIREVVEAVHHHRKLRP